MPHKGSNIFSSAARRALYRVRLWRYDFGRFRLHFAAAIRAGSTVLGVAAAVASLLCIVDLLLYFGFDHNPSDRGLLRGGLRALQAVFAANVLYSLVLRGRATLRDSRVLKWIVDAGVLLSLLPWLYPRPEHPWIPWLDTVLYSHAFLFGVMAAYSLVNICYTAIRLLAFRTNPSLLLSASFLFFILAGSLVLMLPRCTVMPISYVDSLFVSTSAVCITGLTPVDVSATFTPLGLLVLSILIQIGGLGVLTFTSFFALFFSGAPSIYSQLMLRDMVYSRSLNALLPTLLYVLGFTVAVEAIGAVAIYFTVPPEMGFDTQEQVVFSAFLSLSAFCNAGFTNIPDGMGNAALMAGNQWIYVATSVIVLAGAIGFPILVNFKDVLVLRMRRLWARMRGRRFVCPVHIYDLNTKLVLTASLTILAIGTAAFFVLEYDNTLAGMPWWKKLAQSLFNATAPRSSGFSSVSPAASLPATLLVVVVQMWIGGASQSMAGGIKVNTLAVVLLNLRSIVYGDAGVAAFRRGIAIPSVRRANAVVSLSIIAFVAYALVVLLLEPSLGARELLFETVSALFTVGSSLGVTDSLGDTTKVVLCTAMFVGRVGILSLLMGLVRSRRDASSHFPKESVIIN